MSGAKAAILLSRCYTGQNISELKQGLTYTKVEPPIDVIVFAECRSAGRLGFDIEISDKDRVMCMVSDSKRRTLVSIRFQGEFEAGELFWSKRNRRLKLTSGTVLCSSRRLT
jgi:hypothetical protein